NRERPLIDTKRPFSVICIINELLTDGYSHQAMHFGNRRKRDYTSDRSAHSTNPNNLPDCQKNYAFEDSPDLNRRLLSHEYDDPFGQYLQRAHPSYSPLQAPSLCPLPALPVLLRSTIRLCLQFRGLLYAATDIEVSNLSVPLLSRTSNR